MEYLEFEKICRKILLLLLIMVWTSGCAVSVSSEHDYQWQYQDLKALDPVDADEHHFDILAVYIKKTQKAISLRLDLFDLESDNAIDLLIGVDYKPGGGSVHNNLQKNDYWDMIYEFPHHGDIHGYGINGERIRGQKASIFKDSELDTITFRIAPVVSHYEKYPFVMDIYTIDPATGFIKDSVVHVSSRSLPPHQASVNFVFWNKYQPYTPAQTLRMWDGAHSGPAGGRHGLRYIFEAAERYDVPISFCNLDLPVFNVGWGYLGEYGNVDFISGCCSDGCMDEIVSGIDYAKYSANSGSVSLSEKAIEKISSAALTGNEVFLGGDISNSLWANPSTIDRIFRYIHEHPWMLVDKPTALQSSKSIGGASSFDRHFKNFGVDTELFIQFLKEYYSTPESTLKEQAYQSYQNFLYPNHQMDVAALESYFGQIGHLLSAAKWLEKPHKLSTCENDLDWDGEVECVLATENSYLTIELTGGYLAYAFYASDHGIHQITAPMFEVVVGLSDPLSYKPDFGVFADPGLLPGVLALTDERELSYEFNIGESSIELFSSSSERVWKSFQIMDHGLRIGWRYEVPTAIKIPIILDPWTRYKPGWSDLYYVKRENDNWVWGVKNQIQVSIRSTAKFQLDTFLDSKFFIQEPEDPNFDYPTGHYLPYPSAIINMLPAENAQIDLIFDR